MLRRIFWYKFTDLSEVLVASIVYRPDDGGSKHL
jgi:hypothetical protein